MGTTAERSSIPVPATQGGWVELGRTTLGAGASTIDVASLPDKRYYMVLSDLSGSATRELLRFNNDTGSNYAYRYNSNGGSDGTAGGNSLIGAQGIYNTTDERFKVFYIANLSNKEKLVINHSVNMNGSGASNAPNRYEVVGKWANTSNAINEIDLVSWSGGNWASGGELVVLGWDPADTHTNNFWQELASVTADGTSTDMSSGTITAKKYLWIQLYQKGIAGDVRLRFNSDSGSNYTRRYSQNGGADGTDTSVAHISNMIGIGTTPSFGNAFIINNQSNEKLVVGHHVAQNTAGATSVPQRIEFAAKWANTSNQITNVNILSSSGNFPSGSILKVWGAD